jgi:5-methylcytosine-specific restriction endonuclease McrA
MKRSPLRRKRKPSKQPAELERMSAFKEAARAHRGIPPEFHHGCMACGDLLDGGWHAHHVVTQQHVRRADGDVWDPRNAMRLCTPCHDAHHNRTRPIPLSAVPESAFEFADELLGRDGADAYWDRFYAPLVGHRWIGY